MDRFNLSYREVIPDLSQQDKWNEVALNTGGTQSTLQDIKVAEKAGGYCYKDASKNYTRNRFIYWRTYHDVLELSEISLDFNLYENNLRYRFTDSPVLSVTITEHDQFVTILVTTVSSLHKIHFPHPDTIHKVDTVETKSFSIFRDITANSARDPSTYYVIGQTASSNNPIPHTAASFLSANAEEAFFALAYQNSLALFCMNYHTGQTITNVLKEHHIMPRIFSNIRGALSGKTASPDTEYATSLVFNNIGEQTFLSALYRDDTIRLWSTTTLQCVTSTSCIRDGVESRLQGPQTNTLRKINENTLCALSCHSMGSEFVIVSINYDGGSNFSMVRTKVISAPTSDLADFVVSESKIWSLWCSAQGEFSISNFSLIPGSGINWVSAAMEPPPDRYCVAVEQGVDPRQAYCSYIFHPGKFEKSVIAKALIMFRRSNVHFDTNLPLSILKDRVCQAVETEIQNEIKDFEVTDDEYIDVSTRFWERFYSCCEQYHIKSCQPVGLVLLDPIDAICVVKKNTFSLLRPCEILEHLLLTGENVDIDNVLLSHFTGNEKIGEDFVRLVTLLAQLEQWMGDDVKLDFDKKLYQLEMPDIVISKLVSEILSSDQNREILPLNFMVTIRQNLQSISDLRGAMAMLLESLRMDHGNPEAMQTHEGLGEKARHYFSIGNIFGSSVGISLLSESVRQISLTRYAMCRNLLILQQILIDTFSLNCDVLETIRSQFMPEAVVFVQSYYVMVWICETPVNFYQTPSLESSVQRLSLLQLSDSRPAVGSQQFCSPLLRVFLNSKGLYTALSLFSEGPLKEIHDPQWQFTLIPITTIVSQLIWAVSGNFVFGEWLFGSCQHIIIQEYVRLLNSWCEWNNCSRQFILAVSLLDNGETHKAYDLFLQSAKGVQTEQFLHDKILKPQQDLTTSEATAQYYLKVIQLFEQHNALDLIIPLATTAIGILDKTDPQLPMFQSIVFNNHLLLEHYEEAYHSLVSNADPSRRKDCLRQLVVCLFNKKRLDLLMHFPYNGLQDEFENIVESRARSMSIDENEIYNFLYAFHIAKGNMRKASSIMYEQAMRFLLESDSIEAMHKRYDCLLICINSLHLIDKNYQWIAKPVFNDDSPQSNAMEEDNDNCKEQVIVLEIKDIQKELLQTEAFICLAKHRRDIGSFVNAGAQELTAILSNCGLYTAALKLAKGHNISISPIFDSLAAACVRAADENPNEPWAWLQENDLADLPHKNSASDMAWSLLQKLIEDHEERGSTLIRKSVVNKLLSLNAFLPQWLYSSYKADNAAELLRLFVTHSRLLEATDLAKEYIWAMLGLGCEYFNLKHPLTATTPSMCFPIHTIDMLIHGLKINSSDVEYKQSLVELEELVQNYIETATRVSADKVQYGYQLAMDITNKA